VELEILEQLGMYKPLDHHHKRFDNLGQRCESPIERIFWDAGYFILSRYGQITPQVNIGRYRVDFTYTTEVNKIIVELDGQNWHSTPEQRAYDYQRERELQREGWQVVRFTGAEIYGDVQGAVFEVLKLTEVE
jgi:very-short-patch-repair endonuclease